MKKKKLWLTTDNRKYCWVKVFNTLEEMREAYHQFRSYEKNWNDVQGVHCGYEKLKIEKGKRPKTTSETGTVFLSKTHCGAGVVTHELLHAVLWAKQHKHRWKTQYPITIKSMKEEERLAHNHTYAVTQFYNWFFDEVKGKRV